ncbi:MAG: hypothetical protein R3231_02685 [bacterium]|nr:hypothetical protein [bacterium]
MAKHIVILVCITLWSSVAYADVKRYEVPIGDAPSRGPVDAPVTVIEFLDFQ